jgi:subtilisin family serine protease
VLATLLCAAPLLAAPTNASGSLPDRVALREVLRHEARASASGAMPLPLPETPAKRGERPRAAAASAARDVASLARDAGPARVLVGARAHRDMPGLAAALLRLGAETEVFDTIGVIAATVPSGAALAARLEDDPRVAYVERDRNLRIAADPFDVVDPLTGVKYTWAYDGVRAGEALAAAGGGSRRTIAVVDTGLDLTHPEFAGRVERTFDTVSGGADVTDFVGHGTFVTGLIAAVDGNGIGGKGVAGNTRVIPVRASVTDEFPAENLVRGMQFAVKRGADVLNISLTSPTISRSEVRALESAFFNDVLPVAASGNHGNEGNPLEFPAAVLGGRRGGRGIGLSVSATRPDGSFGEFSTHNDFVSLAAPGAGPSGCEFGVFSTLPASARLWDDPTSCSRTFFDGATRYAYGEGTSFSAPLAAGIAALVWQIEPRLASEQVADVLVRSAQQTVGEGWNEFTGTGIVDGAAATALARTYDVTAPRVRARASRRGGSIAVRVLRSKDRTERGRELAGRVSYGLLVSRDGGGSFSTVVRQRHRPFGKTVRISGRRANVVVATVCDGNGNCGVKRLGRFSAR